MIDHNFFNVFPVLVKVVMCETIGQFMSENKV